MYPLRARLKSAVALFFGLLFFFIFGPGFTAVGTQRLTVTCTRSDTVECRVREGYLFGLFSLHRVAHDVTDISIHTHNDEGELLSSLSLATSTGNVRLLLGASNMNDGEKRALHDELSTFLRGNAPSIEVRKSFYNVFALFGAPCFLLWLALVWGLIMWPLTFVYPALLEVDLAKRVVRVRPTIGKALVHEVPFERISSLGLTVNSGGATGRLAERMQRLPKNSTSASDEPARPPTQHLRFELTSGEPVTMINAALFPDGEMLELVRELSRLTGKPLTAQIA